jgi:catechol 2,3-dioxygenase-like lactoylglutathione lyase family enzyme
MAFVFDHVTSRVSEREASERFYRLVLAALGVEQSYRGEDLAEWNDFSLAAASEERPVTRHLHIGFVARSRAAVDEFWRVGTDAGYRDDGAPGLRPQYHSDYYGSFLRDPDRNSAEAVHHGFPRDGGTVDHLWIRVADAPTSARFYRTIAPHVGLRVHRETEERVQFGDDDSSFSVVRGMPTEHLHMAFAARDDESVRAFHRTATDAGYRDNGAPAERLEYHPRYYAAFVLDPDGNNVEVVNHNR